jgi:PRTRC genetic system protein A
MDPRDMALARSFPIYAVPKYSPFEPLESHGQRLLIAGNGFFLEVRREWLYAIEECAYSDGAIRYPFGDVASVIVLPIIHEIGHMVKDFITQARAHLPNEVGAVGVYDRQLRRCLLKPCDTLSASTSRLTYAPPKLAPSETIAVDIHSHGGASACFSDTDDADDMAAVKLAMVVGRVDTDRPEVCARLCLNGLFVSLTECATRTGVVVDAQSTIPELNRGANVK